MTKSFHEIDKLLEDLLSNLHSNTDNISVKYKFKTLASILNEYSRSGDMSADYYDFHKNLCLALDLMMDTWSRAEFDDINEIMNSLETLVLNISEPANEFSKSFVYYYGRIMSTLIRFNILHRSSFSSICVKYLQWCKLSGIGINGYRNVWRSFFYFLRTTILWSTGSSSCLEDDPEVRRTIEELLSEIPTMVTSSLNLLHHWYNKEVQFLSNEQLSGLLLARESACFGMLILSLFISSDENSAFENRLSQPNLENSLQKWLSDLIGSYYLTWLKMLYDVWKFVLPRNDIFANFQKPLSSQSVPADFQLSCFPSFVEISSCFHSKSSVVVEEVFLCTTIWDLFVDLNQSIRSCSLVLLIRLIHWNSSRFVNSWNWFLGEDSTIMKSLSSCCNEIVREGLTSCNETTRDTSSKVDKYSSIDSVVVDSVSIATLVEQCHSPVWSSCFFRYSSLVTFLGYYCLQITLHSIHLSRWFQLYLSDLPSMMDKIPNQKSGHRCSPEKNKGVSRFSHGNKESTGMYKHVLDIVQILVVSCRWDAQNGDDYSIKFNLLAYLIAQYISCNKASSTTSSHSISSSGRSSTNGNDDDDSNDRINVITCTTSRKISHLDEIFASFLISISNWSTELLLDVPNTRSSIAMKKTSMLHDLGRMFSFNHCCNTKSASVSSFVKSMDMLRSISPWNHVEKLPLHISFAGQLMTWWTTLFILLYETPIFSCVCYHMTVNSGTSLPSELTPNPSISLLEISLDWTTITSYKTLHLDYVTDSILSHSSTWKQTKPNKNRTNYRGKGQSTGVDDKQLKIYEHLEDSCRQFLATVAKMWSDIWLCFSSKFASQREQYFRFPLSRYLIHVLSRPQSRYFLWRMNGMTVVRSIVSSKALSGLSSDLWKDAIGYSPFEIIELLVKGSEDADHQVRMEVASLLESIDEEFWKKLLLSTEEGNSLGGITILRIITRLSQDSTGTVRTACLQSLGHLLSKSIVAHDWIFVSNPPPLLSSTSPLSDGPYQLHVENARIILEICIKCCRDSKLSVRIQAMWALGNFLAEILPVRQHGICVQCDRLSCDHGSSLLLCGKNTLFPLASRRENGEGRDSWDLISDTMWTQLSSLCLDCLEDSEKSLASTVRCLSILAAGCSPWDYSHFALLYDMVYTLIRKVLLTLPMKCWEGGSDGNEKEGNPESGVSSESVCVSPLPSRRPIKAMSSSSVTPSSIAWSNGEKETEPFVSSVLWNQRKMISIFQEDDLLSQLKLSIQNKSSKLLHATCQTLGIIAWVLVYKGDQDNDSVAPKVTACISTLRIVFESLLRWGALKTQLQAARSLIIICASKRSLAALSNSPMVTTNGLDSCSEDSNAPSLSKSSNQAYPTALCRSNSRKAASISALEACLVTISKDMNLDTISDLSNIKKSCGCSGVQEARIDLFSKMRLLLLWVLLRELFEGSMHLVVAETSDILVESTPNSIHRSQVDDLFGVKDMQDYSEMASSVLLFHLEELVEWLEKLKEKRDPNEEVIEFNDCCLSMPTGIDISGPLVLSSLLPQSIPHVVQQIAKLLMNVDCLLPSSTRRMEGSYGLSSIFERLKLLASYSTVQSSSSYSAWEETTEI